MCLIFIFINIKLCCILNVWAIFLITIKYEAKIKADELVKFEFVDEYHGISPCLKLYFKDGKIYPIREHKFDEYLKLILN